MPFSLHRLPEQVDGLPLVGARLLLSGIFIHEGLDLAIHIESAVSAMGRLGVPWPMALAAIALQLGAGMAVAIGWHTRVAALALGLFCIATATLFHADLVRHEELLQFEKDLAIAGGMGVLLVYGPGRYAIDGIRKMHLCASTSGATEAP